MPANAPTPQNDNGAADVAGGGDPLSEGLWFDDSFMMGILIGPSPLFVVCSLSNRTLLLAREVSPLSGKSDFLVSLRLVQVRRLVGS